MRHLFINILLLVGLLGGLGSSIPRTQQDDSIVFRNMSVESDFPNGITFRIEICGRPPSSKIAFYYTTSANAYSGWSKEIWTLDEGKTADNCDKRKFYLETREFDIPPFTPIKNYWAVSQGDTATQSPKYVYYYRDTNHNWESTEDENFVIWWHDRPESFGDEILYLASSAQQDQTALYPISLDDPIIIVITNSHEEFFAWQGEEDYAGGLAFPELNLTIQLVEDDIDYHDWLSDVIPHEVSHIYFNHWVKRFSGAPYWFDEGLATYLEYSDHLYEWELVKTAQAANTLLPLETLEYDFGEDEEKISLAYAESYYAVLYMDEVYGDAVTSALLSEFHKGSSMTTGFEKTFNKTPDEFEKDFLAWLETRIKTAPPDTEIQFPTPQPETKLEETKTLSSALVSALLLLPACLVFFGVWVLALFLVVYKLYSKKERKSKIT